MISNGNGDHQGNYSGLVTEVKDGAGNSLILVFVAFCSFSVMILISCLQKRKVLSDGFVSLEYLIVSRVEDFF